MLGSVAYERCVTEPVARPADADLARAARAGNRAAFAELVERYQTLIKSLAYGLTGNLTESEEIAQATFVTAWRDLGSLREPDRFRAWLCIIARNFCHHWNKTHAAAARTASRRRPDVASREPSPFDQVVRQQEMRALWNALSKIPDVYRVPLVLFYGEAKSTRRVAEMLDLSEESVRKRLSRARKMLQEEVAFVEAVLPRIRLGKGFATAVLAAIVSGAGEAIARPRGAPAGFATRLAAWQRWGMTLVTVSAGIASLAYVAPERRSDARHLVAASAAPAPLARGIPQLASATSTDMPPRGPNLSSTSQAPSPLQGSTIFAFDFEDGLVPSFMEFGHVTPTPGRPGNRYAAVATTYFWGRSSVRGMETGIGFRSNFETSFHRTLVLSFDYRAGADENRAVVQIWNEAKRRNYLRCVQGFVQDRWTRVHLALGAFTPYPRVPQTPMDDGDPLRDLLVIAGRPGGMPFLVDNIELGALPVGELWQITDDGMAIAECSPRRPL